MADLQTEAAYQANAERLGRDGATPHLSGLTGAQMHFVA